MSRRWVERRRAVMSVVFPLVFVATGILGYYLWAAAARLSSLEEEAIIESTLLLVREKVESIEQMIIDSGTHLTKFWFSVTQSEQRTRFAIRQLDPVRRWKLSPMDLESLDRWEAYTEAKEEMFRRTDTDHAPWTMIRSNDKKRARLNAMRFFLSQFDYTDKDETIVMPPDPLLVKRARDMTGD